MTWITLYQSTRRNWIAGVAELILCGEHEEAEDVLLHLSVIYGWRPLSFLTGQVLQ